MQEFCLFSQSTEGLQVYMDVVSICMCIWDVGDEA